MHLSQKKNGERLAERFSEDFTMASTFCSSADNFSVDKVENVMTIKFDMRVTFVPFPEIFICSFSS